jgi:hypothetical protein
VVSERAVRAAARRAGEPGGIRFTERQLYYELCRGLRPWHRAPRRWSFTVRPPVSYRDFRVALAGAGQLPGLLPPARPRTAVGRFTTEPDLYDYGLPRLLLCQSTDIADMLRANGIATESACPVFAAAELPLDPRVAAMLTLGGGTVYALHDASPDGMAFPDAVAAELPEGTRLTSLGLRPRQAGVLHLTHGRAPTAAEAPDGEPWERRWFGRGRFVEVAAVAPAALLRTVHRLVRGVRPRRPRWTGGRRSGFLSWPTP